MKTLSASSPLTKVYLRFLAAELFGVVFAILVFKVVENRIIAGALAGAVFLAIGLYIVGSAARLKAARKSGSFALGCVHLFVVAIPMLVTRLLNYSTEFSEVRIWGLPGPVFHRLSTTLYFALMIATLVDLCLAWRRENKKARKSASLS